MDNKNVPTNAGDWSDGSAGRRPAGPQSEELDGDVKSLITDDPRNALITEPTRVKLEQAFTNVHNLGGGRVFVPVAGGEPFMFAVEKADPKSLITAITEPRMDFNASPFAIYWIAPFRPATHMSGWMLAASLQIVRTHCSLRDELQHNEVNTLKRRALHLEEIVRQSERRADGLRNSISFLGLVVCAVSGVVIGLWATRKS